MHTPALKCFPILPHMQDATSWYRGQFPLTDLAHRKNLQLVYSATVDWSTVSLCDIMFLQRPFTQKEHVISAQIAQKLGKTVWCDWDDDLFCVPPDNPAHQTYSDKDIQMSVAMLAAMADVVTVSTRDLAKRFDEIRKKAGKPDCVIIPNSLSDHFLKKRQARNTDPARRKLIFWRGSASHQADLDSVQDEFLEIMKSEPNWSCHFMGYNPYRITNELPKQRCIVGGGMDILDYHEYVMQIQPGITIVPLVFNEFNAAKSNIAWLETTLAHSLVVAPDMPEWKQPGVFLYGKDGASFTEALRAAMKSVEDSRYESVDASWRKIENCLLLSQVNEKRWEILKRLAPHKPQD